MKIKFSLIIFCFFFLLVIFIYQFFRFHNKKLSVVFCNVGQGDSIYMRTPSGADILVDAGSNSKVLECLGRHMPFWDKTIELAFSTHPDADHIGGYSYILDSYKIKLYSTPKIEKDTGIFKIINEKLKLKKVKINYIYAYDTFKISDGVLLKSFWPSRKFINEGSKETNRYSLVQTLNYKNFDVLLTGDIEFDILNDIFKNGIKIDIFKLPHHGSKTGINTNTLRLISAKIAIISAGLNNRYGHPHKVVLDELEKHNLKFLETSKLGDIKITSDGKYWRIE